MNDIPVVSYGPWSVENETIEPGITAGPIDLLGAISRSRASSSSSPAPPAAPSPHELVPGFWWDGDDERDPVPGRHRRDWASTARSSTSTSTPTTTA